MISTFTFPLTSHLKPHIIILAKELGINFKANEARRDGHL